MNLKKIQTMSVGKGEFNSLDPLTLCLRICGILIQEGSHIIKNVYLSGIQAQDKSTPVGSSRDCK